MKSNFRQQVSNYDCTPSCIINGLSYLFHRHEVPPFIVYRVYKDCLDGDASRGTSERATREMAYLLNSYRDPRYKSFAVEAKLIYGTQVHLRKKSKIIGCIEDGGAALLCVHSSNNFWHYILAFYHEDGWLHCFDPSPRTRRYLNNDAVQFDLNSGHQEANLLIRCDWLDRDFTGARNHHNNKYIFGSTDNRECFLLNRISP
ncbi:hypothetical protein KI809_09315 [Geobacter pelophilus]|uniref:Peptidase C39 domain-containing protein n=1 Tax=Geoanaerobacter pelophilus TaxID=60036 RepID=A0AAW4L4L1_9BACT|nr:hypothetical protein [Geoanaerobacter pelophilus]MBT0664497.1 hypothetical protein [Geoanaerobacter pelophilus]